MILHWKLSEHAQATVQLQRLPGETLEECADRLLANLLVISVDVDNYEQHFGPQQRSEAPIRRYPRGALHRATK